MVRSGVAGLLIGLANVIPGVSGGTMAVIVGVFERLINTVDGLTKLRLKRDDLLFLVVLGVGVVLGLLLGSKVLVFAFKTYPYYTYAFFYGLILFSLYDLKDQVKHFRIVEFLAGFFVVVFPYFLAHGGFVRDLGNLSTAELFVFIPLSGALAGASMVLPGLSGSLVLMLLGYYHQAIEIVSRFPLKITSKEILFLISLGVGILVGIVVIVRLLNLWFEKARSSIMNFILGLLTGSLYPITPGFHGTGNVVLLLVWISVGAGLLIVLKKLSYKRLSAI
ncbi:DUF368 domain-containing protein [Fervidobacterium thailandense]|uniref:DUF368 domain-containing protein n=2 Tax=Fervidobacterium thailandense TaxID=1008305 RepID=A0A1E3G5L2_9BACT|nr:DUF368 domain-containing protein [Fervidobacterium thailandense]